MKKIQMIEYITNNITDIIMPKKKLEQLNEICNKYDSENLFYKIYENIKVEIYNLISECVISEYHHKRICNEIIGNDRESRILYFTKKFSESKNFAVEFIEKYNILNELLRIRVNDLLDFNIEVIKNYNNDISLLNDKLSLELGKIINIPLKSGDLHNGKAVTSVECENGKIMYKPRNMSTDIFVEKIMNYISKVLPNCPEILFPKNLSFDNYSWQEFIERKDCENIEQVHEYYHRTGIYLAVFYLLSTIDMHFENMISYGEHPVFIDLETIIRGEISSITSMQDDKTDYKSVLVSNMLPALTNSGLFDINMSALFTGKTKSKKMFNTHVAPDENLDWVYIKENVSIQGTHNDLFYNGEEIEPWKVEKDLINGFRKTLEVLINNKNEFIDYLKDITINENIKIRQILRPTHVYWRFINASHHPDYLSSDEKYNSIFDILFSNFTIGNHGFLRVEKEVNDLKKGYIPSFYALLNDKALYSDENIICNNYFYETPLETVLKKIESLNINMIDYQERFIKMSFLTLYGIDKPKNSIDTYSTNMKDNKLIFQHLTEDDVEKMLKEYVDYLVKNLIPLENNCFSLIMPHIDTNGFIIQGMENELYQVGGLIWFLAIYSKTYENKYTKYPKGMLNTLITKYTKEKLSNKVEHNFSVYAGNGSLVYLTYNFYKLFKEKSYIDITQEIVTDIISYYRKSSLSKLYDTDFYRGLPGVLYVLCKIFLDTKEFSEVEDIIKIDDLIFIGDKFYDFINMNNNNEYGFAHGLSGISVTISILYKITNNKRYNVLLKELLMKEKSLGNLNKKVYSWCKGESGVLLSRHIMLKYSQDNKELSDLIISSMPDINEQNLNSFLNLDDYCVCHGLYGNIDILNSINYKNNNYLYKKHFDSLLNIKWFEHSDYHYEGFMVGSSGVAYSLMRLFKKIPSVLSLDIY